MESITGYYLIKFVPEVYAHRFSMRFTLTLNLKSCGRIRIWLTMQFTKVTNLCRERYIASFVGVILNMPKITALISLNAEMLYVAK
jgi:hypothetical protein